MWKTSHHFWLVAVDGLTAPIFLKATRFSSEAVGKGFLPSRATRSQGEQFPQMQMWLCKNQETRTGGLARRGAHGHRGAQGHRQALSLFLDLTSHLCLDHSGLLRIARPEQFPFSPSGSWKFTVRHTGGHGCSLPDLRDLWAATCSLHAHAHVALP